MVQKGLHAVVSDGWLVQGMQTKSVQPVGFLPPQVKKYPELRYMGSKSRLLPWIHSVLSALDFETAADPFSGSGCVAYLLKAMGKAVTASDFLHFPFVIATAAVENSTVAVDGKCMKTLLSKPQHRVDFIESTFSGIFFEKDDLKFLDRVSGNISKLSCPFEIALARSALIRSCLKKQPRGVFTVSGDLSRYDDGRRDLQMSLEDHFCEQVSAYNDIVFDNGNMNKAFHRDVFADEPATAPDLVYLDPPYVPRSDDNCYVKRYHFVEGLSCYWNGMSIMEDTKVRKIAKRYTPFSYRKSAINAFARMFEKYRSSTIVLSYSSNGFPDLDVILGCLGNNKKNIDVFERPHRYHFGT